MTVFEHLTYNRDKRPVLDRRFTKKYLFASQSDESGELRDQIRKLQKRVVVFVITRLKTHSIIFFIAEWRNCRGICLAAPASNWSANTSIYERDPSLALWYSHGNVKFGFSLEDLLCAQGKSNSWRIPWILGRNYWILKEIENSPLI